MDNMVKGVLKLTFRHKKGEMKAGKWIWMLKYP